MMKFEIRDIAVEQKSGNAKVSGKPYTIRTQTAWTVLDGESRKVPVNLEADQPAYEVGRDYVLGDGSFFFGDFGRLMLGRLVLVRAGSSAARLDPKLG
jgi:hypothetical protein